MSNPLRGEASFRAGASTFTLVYDVNAFCELEEETSYSISELVAQVRGNPSFTLLRSIVCAGLQAKHPSTSKAEAGEIMADAGIQPVMDAMKKAFETAMPPAKKPGADVAAEEGKGKAPKKTTGSPS